MKKKYVLIVVMFVIISSLIIKTDFNPDIIKAETTDRYPPQISAVSANPQTVGFGFNITISPTVTDNLSGINLVKINVTYPDSSYGNFSMNKKQGSTYELIFSDTWQHGRYNYSIWANDNASNANSSSQQSFNVTVYSTIAIATLKDNYTDNEYINITDPPNPTENLTVVGRGLTWNTYYDASSGDNILDSYQGPINYKAENGTWIPINSSLRQLTNNHPAYNYGYRTGNDRGLFNVYFKPNIQNNWPVAFAYNRSTDPTIHVIRSKLVGVGYLDPGSNWSYQYLQNVQSSQGLVTNDSILYENVFTGTNVVYSYENTRLKENIILSNATKTVLQNHPPSLYGCGNNSFLVFITKLDFQNLQPYNASTPIMDNLTISEGQIDFRDAAGVLQCSLPIGEAYEQMNESMRHQLTYRIIQYNGNYFLLSGLRVADLMQMTFPVIIDPTQEKNTWLSSTSDGYIYKSSSTSYNTAWSAGTGTISSSADYITIGQNKGSTLPNPTYYVYRGFLIFNTSSLPSNAYIDNATLSLYKKGDNSTTDFTLTIQNGQPTYPHNPLLFGDYNKSHYTNNGGGLNTTNFANGRNTITLTNHSWIQKAGMTKFCLRSSRDINGTTPTTKEYVDVYSKEKGTSYAPKLIIHYRNQSKIKNTGSTDIKGYLSIQIQYYYEQSWYDVEDVINETSTRTIIAGNQLPLDIIFNGLVNTSDISFDNGTYRVYAVLRDPYGDALVGNDNQVLVGFYEFHLCRPRYGWRKLLVQDGFWKGSILTSHNVATRGMAIYKGELYVGTENLNKWKWYFQNNFNGFDDLTQITMADGSYQNIEYIQAGDLVKAYDMGSHEYVNATVQIVCQHTSEESCGILNINSKVYSSPNQVFLVNGVLKEARDIEIGDNLTNVHGENITVSSIANSSSLGDVYNFMIGASNDTLLQPNNLTFFADDITAYPWGSDGANESWGEAEAMGVDLTDDIPTWGSEFTYKWRAEASDGCEIWKYNQSTQHWTSVINGTGTGNTSAGFGNATNWGTGEIIEFNGSLYVGTWSSPKYGCEIWRFNGSTWTNVVGRFGPIWGCGFGNIHNCAVTSMTVFKGHLYVGTMNFDWSNNGFCEVWRNNNSNCTDWVKVVDNGFRDGSGAGPTARNAYAWRMVNFSGMLYVGTFNIPIPWWGERGCELFRSGTGNSGDWHIMNLSGGQGFGEKENYGIRGLVNWNNQYLYVGVAANFFQLYLPNYWPQALEIWRYDNSSPTTPWVNVIGDKTADYPSPYSDGFGSYYNKYPWSMALCGNKLWIGTLNEQLFGNPHSYGCEVWYYDGSTVTASVKNPEGSEHFQELNGFGHNYTIASRSMIEFPKDSGQLIVGTVTLRYQFRPLEWEPGCEVWIHYP
jgi:hypothetical protein